MSHFSPLHILRFLMMPNILMADICCGLLYFFQFTLLTSVASIFNLRFHLTTPLISGLFYLASGGGFIIGSIIGGVISDRTTKRYIQKRDGRQLPEDRLNGGLFMWFVVLPVSMLIYGWMLDTEAGGMVVPIISSFFVGFGIVGAFNGLNTCTGEILPEHKERVMSGKYLIQYAFGAASSAAALPMIRALGVGWTFSTCAIIALVGGVLLLCISRAQEQAMFDSRNMPREKRKIRDISFYIKIIEVFNWIKSNMGCDPETRFVDFPDEELKEYWLARGISTAPTSEVSHQPSELCVDDLLSCGDVVARGLMKDVTSTVETLTGMKPISFRDAISKYKKG